LTPLEGAKSPERRSETCESSGSDFAPLDAAHRCREALEVVEHHEVLATRLVDSDDLAEAAELGARAVVVLEVDGDLACTVERMILRGDLDEGPVGDGGRSQLTGE